MYFSQQTALPSLAVSHSIFPSTDFENGTFIQKRGNFMQITKATV